MERLSETIKTFSKEFYRNMPVGTVDVDGTEENLHRFFRRLERGSLTRDENPYDHFCVYFAAFDPPREIFIGRHIKSGLWLFNGGHIDAGETPREAAVREIAEEWGNVSYKLPDVPSLLTITDIRSETVGCKLHWDIWYFVPLSKDAFSPEADKLNTEFYETGWYPIESAMNLITDPSTLKAIEVLKANMAKSKID